MGEAPAKLVEMGRSRGFVVKNYTILSLDEIRLTTRELWNWNGAPTSPGAPTAAASEMKRAPIEDRMDKAWSRHAGSTPPRVGRVLLLAQVDPAGALGPGSWHHDILTRLGATAAIQQGNAFVTMDAEDVLRCAPDAIILFSPRSPGAPARTSPPTPAELLAMLGALGKLHIPAVENKRLAFIGRPDVPPAEHRDDRSRRGDGDDPGTMVGVRRVLGAGVLVLRSCVLRTQGPRTGVTIVLGRKQITPWTGPLARSWVA